MFLLLYAQAIVRIVDLKVSAVSVSPEGTMIVFVDDPVLVPPPFADLLTSHLTTQPNQRGANSNSDWLFPSTRAGRHLHANTVMDRLRGPRDQPAGRT